MTPRQHATLLHRCEREYLAALRAEEDAATLTGAWRAAAASERALRRVQLVRAGLPLPVPQAPRTARNLARAGFAALALIGRVVARALAREAALRKARVAATLARTARRVARVARAALRRALAVVVAALKASPAPTVSPACHDAPMLLDPHYGRVTELWRWLVSREVWLPLSRDSPTFAAAAATSVRPPR